MDFANSDWLEATAPTTVAFAGDSPAARAQLALFASRHAGVAEFEGCSARHTRACETAIASLFEGAQ